MVDTLALVLDDASQKDIGDCKMWQKNNFEGESELDFDSEENESESESVADTDVSTGFDSASVNTKVNYRIEQAPMVELVL